MMAEEVGQIGAYRLLTAAIGEGDPETARAAADRVLRPATASLLTALAALTMALERDMTKASPEIEKLAAERLAADEERITGPGARNVSLRGAWRAFWQAPEPVADLGAFLARPPVAARVVVGGGSWWELLIPVGLVALFPVIEWVIHVGDPALAPAPLGPVRSTRCWPASTASTTPTRATSRWCSSRGRSLCLAAAGVRRGRAARDADASSALTLLVSVYGAHVRLRVDPLPRAQRLPAAVAWFRSVWRNHRLHHYKNEHYWFTVTTAGTADRLFGTYPEPSTVETSPTVQGPARQRGHPGELGRRPLRGGSSLQIANGSSSSRVSDAAAGGRGRS